MPEHYSEHAQRIAQPALQAMHVRTNATDATNERLRDTHEIGHVGIPAEAVDNGVSRLVIYVAGPMTGLPEFNYPAFRAAEADLRASGYDVLNPADSEAENTTGQPQAWEWYMRRALAMVIRADGIALLNGWAGSRGARLEVAVGKELGLDIRYIDWWTA